MKQKVKQIDNRLEALEMKEFSSLKVCIVKSEQQELQLCNEPQSEQEQLILIRCY